jgi:hypothetical protein
MNLEITHQQGGMLEFERTGIYPEYLIFNFPGTPQSWRIRIKKKFQEGVLKSKGKIVYHYRWVLKILFFDFSTKQTPLVL